MFLFFWLFFFRCITIEYTAPTGNMFYKENNLKVIAGKLLELLKDLSLDENPIIVHAFSNGGGMMYRYISEHKRKSPQHKNVNIVGAIFDSLPAERKAKIAVRALMTSLTTNIIFKLLLGLLLYIFLVGRDVFQTLFSFSKRKATYWDYMYNESGKWPSLYLYSKADEIVNYLYVEAVIEHRKGLGCDIQSLCWNDSAHVQHLRAHRESYVSNCHRFIGSCLKKAANHSAKHVKQQ